MALEDIIKQEQPSAPKQTAEDEAPEQNKLTDEEEDDLAISVMLAQNMIDDAGWEIINKALTESSDPSTVIGQFLMQLVSQMGEQLPPEAQLSPRVFLAEGGWLEQVSDYLQEQYDVPRDVMDKVEIFIASQSASMANGAVQEQTASAQPEPQPQPVGLEGMMGGMV